MQLHHYKTTITWTGNTGTGTSGIKAYERDHIISVEGKPDIPGTSEVSLLGNRLRYNPEELLLAAVSACHMLWYLYLCARDGIVVTAYEDRASGTMENTANGGGRFTGITLRPAIAISGAIDEEHLARLQHEANSLCYIASSCNFPIGHEASYRAAG